MSNSDSDCLMQGYFQLHIFGYWFSFGITSHSQFEQQSLWPCMASKQGYSNFLCTVYGHNQQLS